MLTILEGVTHTQKWQPSSSRGRMKPIESQYSQIIAAAADAISAQIADTDRWSEFRGYWMLPGIKSAQYENRTEGMVGSRIHVVNTDGSQHIEEILGWDAEARIVMRLQEFTPPLSSLVAHIDENWSFESDGQTTLVIRTTRIHPKSILTWPLAWLISLLFKKAIARSLQQMAEAANST